MGRLSGRPVYAWVLYNTCSVSVGDNDDAVTSTVQQHRRFLILTRAGCSTDSGIPDYRDHKGEWKRRKPILYQGFMGSEVVRQRYWTRNRCCRFIANPSVLKSACIRRSL